MQSSTNPIHQEFNSGPHHHIHGDSEPIPGARGAAPTVDYTPETIERTRLPPSEEGNTQDFAPRADLHSGHTHGNTHHNATPSGGVTNDLMPPKEMDASRHVHDDHHHFKPAHVGEGQPYHGPTSMDKPEGTTGIWAGTTGTNTGQFADPSTKSSIAHKLEQLPAKHHDTGITYSSNNKGAAEPIGGTYPDRHDDTHTSNNKPSITEKIKDKTEQHHDTSNTTHNTNTTNTKPSMGDKIIGKTQKIVGKVAHNPQMQEEGAMRAQGERN
ncbi:hypothetical protein B0H34DRAFT_719922 [Crassisporium funariophilum]|nr:hypothetical protein B0H34DRAFT_719922 [Crassisporium funariophilum]